MVKMDYGQISSPMMNQQGNQMPVPVQQMQQDSLQQHMPMQADFNKMMQQQRMKLNPQAQVCFSFSSFNYNQISEIFI